MKRTILNLAVISMISEINAEDESNKLRVIPKLRSPF